MSSKKDILSDKDNFDIFKEYENNLNIKIEDLQLEENKIVFNYEVIVTENKKDTKKSFSIWSGIVFLIKYIATTSAIFWVLLVTTNYSAYIQVAKSIIFKEQVEQTKNGILNSVEAAKIKTKLVEETSANNEEESLEASTIQKYKKDLEEKEINLNIEITPFTNRVIVPKIWKNIPLLEVQNKTISWESELNDIFMKELENGIIRYPGSAKPGKEWNSFIFGHSSNLPWMKWEYNDVFAQLDNLVYWDEVIAYYGQEKYTYKIREKKVIKPGDVSILKQEPNKTKITLMTCRPIGTTINRLVVIWELVEKE